MEPHPFIDLDMKYYTTLTDNDPDYLQEQIEGHNNIAERKASCFFCTYFNGCHTAVWRRGQTCELFCADKNKLI